MVPGYKFWQKKMHNLKRHIYVALSANSMKARFLAKIGGKCIAMMYAVLPAKLFLCNVYCNIVFQVNKNCKMDFCGGEMHWPPGMEYPYTRRQYRYS